MTQKGKNVKTNTDATMQVKCKKCSGSGLASVCGDCHGTGKVDCFKCAGIGKYREWCPTCHSAGYVLKTRLINCKTCHGKGYYYNSSHSLHRCFDCHETGQVKEKYKEPCPFCGGAGRSPYEVTCPECKGEKKLMCESCHGSGHIKCDVCGGTGRLHAQAILNDPEVFDRKTGLVCAEVRDEYDGENALIELANAGDADAAWILAKEPDNPEEEELGGYIDKYVLLSASLGSKYGLAKLGEMNVRKGNKEGIEQLVASSKKGCAAAYGMLAVISHLGLLNEPRDDEKAVEYCKLANQTGEGVSSDYVGLQAFVTSLAKALDGDMRAICYIVDYLNAEALVLGEPGENARAEWLSKMLKHEKVGQQALKQLTGLAQKGNGTAKRLLLRNQ